MARLSSVSPPPHRPPSLLFAPWFIAIERDGEVTETPVQFTSEKKVLERRHHQTDLGFPACIQQTEDVECEETLLTHGNLWNQR